MARRRMSWRGAFAILAVALTLAVTPIPGTPAAASGPNPTAGGLVNPAPGGPQNQNGPFVSPTGRYVDLSAQWWQWAFSMPTTQHPLFDSAPCSAGQSGDVWFLGGSFTSSTLVRSCTVPAGKSLFVPVVNTEWDNLGVVPRMSHAQLRTAAGTFIDAATNLSATVDSTTIYPSPSSAYRVKAPTFRYTYAANSIWCFFGFCPPASATGGAVNGAVADGIYVLVEPLPVGTHILRTTVSVPDAGFSLDTTYNLTVTP